MQHFPFQPVGIQSLCSRQYILKNIVIVKEQKHYLLKILWNTKPCFRRNGLGHIGLHGTNCVVGTASLAEDGQQVYSSKVFLIFYQWPHTWACCKLDCWKILNYTGWGGVHGSRHRAPSSSLPGDGIHIVLYTNCAITHKWLSGGGKCWVLWGEHHDQGRQLQAGVHWRVLPKVQSNHSKGNS